MHYCTILYVFPYLDSLFNVLHGPHSVPQRFPYMVLIQDSYRPVGRIPCRILAMIPYRSPIHDVLQDAAKRIPAIILHMIYSRGSCMILTGLFPVLFG